VFLGNQHASLSGSAGFALLNFMLYKVLNVVGVAERLTILFPFHYTDSIRILVTGGASWYNNVIPVLVFFLRENISA
jgi:hypothetical protein